MSSRSASTRSTTTARATARSAARSATASRRYSRAWSRWRNRRPHASPPLGLLPAQRHQRARGVRDEVALLVAHVALREADRLAALHHARFGAQLGVPDRLQ